MNIFSQFSQSPLIFTSPTTIMLAILPLLLLEHLNQERHFKHFCSRISFWKNGIWGTWFLFSNFYIFYSITLPVIIMYEDFQMKNKFTRVASIILYNAPSLISLLSTIPDGHLNKNSLNEPFFWVSLTFPHFSPSGQIICLMISPFMSFDDITGSCCEENKFICSSKSLVWRFYGYSFRRIPVAASKYNRACWLLFRAWTAPAGIWVP